MKVDKKIWQEYFEIVAKGDKNFELRVADWEIDVGDTLVLKEWNHEKKEYTGRELERKVTYLIKTKGAEGWGMWSKEDIDSYGFQIIGFRPESAKIKIMVFTEGTTIMHTAGRDVSREERARQVMDEEASTQDYKTYIPIGHAVEKLHTWAKNGAELYYLTSRITFEEITDIQNVLFKYNFPSGTLLYRQNKEEYTDVAERLMPDVLIEDDCVSIGGEIEMTYTKIKPELKEKIKHLPVKEFGGIDHLPDLVSELGK